MSSGSVNMSLVRPLVAALGASPQAQASLLAAADLTPEMVANGDASVTASQFCIAWATAVRLSSDPSLALRIASATQPGAFGIVEYVCRSSSSVRVALSQWVRYLNLLNSAVVVELDTQGEIAALRVVRDSEAPAPASHELCFALVLQQLRALSATPFQATAVEFTHPVRGEVAAYEAWFKAPVRFSARTTQLLFPSASLDYSLISADPVLLRILEGAADDQLARLSTDAPLTTQIKRLLRNLLRNDETNIDAAAKHLGLSARNLQRHLKDEGTTFQVLREDVRRELATEYLDSGFSVTEISFLLGFSEPSAFFRAFKRWTGVTPLESRAQRRAAVAV